MRLASTVPMLEKLSSNSTMTSFLRLPKTSEHSALDKKDSDIRDQASIESSLTSWLKVEISLTTMALEASPFTVKNSQTKTSKRGTTSLTFFPWQMQARIPTDPSSSSLL